MLLLDQVFHFEFSKCFVIRFSIVALEVKVQVYE